MKYKEGDKVRWRTLNGTQSGIIDYDLGDGNYLCNTSSGLVMVNKDSFI